MLPGSNDGMKAASAQSYKELLSIVIRATEMGGGASDVGARMFGVGVVA